MDWPLDDPCEYYQSHDWKQEKTDSFDAQLAKQAEMFSDKWVKVFQNSTKNDDDYNLNRIIKTTAIGGHNIIRFDLPNPQEQRLYSHPDVVVEQNKLILLDKKYFEFETADHFDVATVGVSDRSEKDNIETYTTIFDQPDDDDPTEHDLNSDEILAIVQTNEQIRPKVQETTQTKTNKKKKRRTKYRPLTCDDVSASASNAPKVFGAPPGVRSTQSALTTARRMDLSKGGNYSLQFRL